MYTSSFWQRSNIRPFGVEEMAVIDIAGNFVPAREGARGLFAQQDPEQMAARSGTVFVAEQSCFLIPYCGTVYRVSYPDGEVAGADLLVSEQVVLLLYLALARGTPLSGRWISFMQLPGGPHHQVPFRLQAVDPLARAFSSDAVAFEKVAQALGAEPLGIGDAGVVIPALPRLPLAFILWTGDVEFPSNANILFDATAPDYLDTAGLYVLGINVSRRLMADH